MRDGEKLMTVDDFIRAILPYRYYQRTRKSVSKRVPSAVEFFKLADTDGGKF